MKFRLFIFFIVIWFFRGFIGEYFLKLDPEIRGTSDPYLLKILLEIPIFLLFIITRKKNRISKTSLSLLIPVLLYFIWSVISAIHNDLSILSALLYSRYLIYSLLLYFISYNLLTTPFLIKKILNLIFVLTLIQILAASINLLIYGTDESRVGTLALQFGSLATIFPLTILAYYTSYYLVISKKNIWLILSVLLLIIGFASGKRALLITLPIFYMFFILLAYRYNIISNDSLNFINLSKVLILIILLIPLINYYVINTDFGQSDNFSDYGVFKKVESVYNYTLEYESGVDLKGYSRGRSGTNLIIISSIFNSDLNKWGIGPMELYYEETKGYGSGYLPLGIKYGIVGWGRDTISIGFMSVFFLLWYIYVLLRKSIIIIKQGYRLSKFIYFINLGCFFSIIVFLFDYFFYSANSFISGFPLFLVTIGMGIVQNSISAHNYWKSNANKL